VNSQPFGQGAADKSGRILQVNRYLCEMLGFDVKALLQRSIRDITHPDDWPETALKVERLLLADEPFSIVKRYLGADGRVIWVQSYVSLMYDAEGSVVLSGLVRPVLPAIGEARRLDREKPSALAQPELGGLMTPPPGFRGVIH